MAYHVVPAHSGLPDITLLVTSDEGEAAWFIKGWGEVHHFGLDLEWKPTFTRGQYSRVATLQICSGPWVLVFDLTAIRRAKAQPLPDTLWSFLENSAHWFYGMGLLDDAARLAFEFDCVINGVDFLGGKAGALQMGGGLVGVANRVLGTAVQQSKKFTMSNWDARPLSSTQLQYLAEDAYLSWGLATYLLSRGPPALEWLVTPAEIYRHAQSVLASGHAVRNSIHNWEPVRAEYEKTAKQRKSLREQKWAGKAKCGTQRPK
mmetsp:Transcript_49786/g.115561  ORF Transcript_49786/g.115561 Transcript_49786/m.115561 type:complete len:261 (+) Transcript_49786:42-824(+)